MSLTKKQADEIASTLTQEFRAVAQIVSTSSLNTGAKVIVYADAKTPEDVLQQIEKRAEELAGYKMTSADFEFKTGRKHF